jgi:hypothetical protein
MQRTNTKKPSRRGQVTGKVKAIQSTSLRANPVQEQYYLYDALGQMSRRDDDVLGTVESVTDLIAIRKFTENASKASYKLALFINESGLRLK